MLSFVLLLIWLGTAGSALYWGLDYYLLPLEARAYSPLDAVFSPTGAVGHGLGVVGTAMIVIGVVGYGARKRIRALERIGALKHWLQVHIFLCTLGPFLVLLHTSFRIGGLVSIAFWSMVVVVGSGVFGRYVYARIPKTVQGRFLSAEAVRARIEELADRLRALVGGPVPPELDRLVTPPARGTAPGLIGALASAVGADLRLRSRQRRVRRLLRDRGVPSKLEGEILGIVRERAKISRQATLLRPFQRMFGYWHAFHLPLAAVMFLILGIHVLVAILFGYTWIF